MQFYRDETRSFPTAKLFIIALCVALIVAFLYHKFRGKDSDKFKIDNTTEVITEIRKIAELGTSCFYEEMVLRDSKPNALTDNEYGKRAATILGDDDGVLIEDEIVVIAKGKVKAGFDLTQMTEDDVLFRNDTLFVTLPHAKILDVIINPSDFEVFSESGYWYDSQIVSLKLRAKQRLVNDAKYEGILSKAEASGQATVSDLLKSSGYSDVVVAIGK